MKNKFTVLVVDEQSSVRKSIIKHLSGSNFIVEEASNAEEAIEKFNKDGMIPHIIISDIRLSGMSGVEFLKEVKKLNSAVEFILMTSYTTAETAVQAIHYGAYDYINKDSMGNKDLIISVFDRVTEKLKMKYQNLYLIEKLKKQNELLKNKHVELIKKAEQLERLNKSVMQSQMKAEQRLQLSNKLYTLLEPKTVLQAACDVIANFHDKYSYLIMTVDESQKALFGAASYPRVDDKLTNMKIEFSKDFDLKKIRFFMETISSYSEFVDMMKKEFGTDKYICRTIKFKQNIPAALFIVVSESNQPIKRINGLDDFVLQISTAYENAILHAKVNEMAIKDGLTNLYNHKHFIDNLNKEITRAKRYKYPLSILFIDIDNFKNFNDNNGHQAGDLVLKKVAKLIQDTSRPNDVIAQRNTKREANPLLYGENTTVVSRYGGEEFAIVLPHTDLKGANIKGERLRELVEKSDFPGQEKQPLGTLTVSIGIAEFNEKFNDAKLLIEAADNALYEAKHAGRNKVIVNSPAVIKQVEAA